MDRMIWRGAAVLLLAGVLTGLAGCGSGSAPADRGARLYMVHCASCHQRDGRGRPGAEPSLAGSPVVAGDAQPLAQWLLFGEPPAGLTRSRGFVRMPPFAWLSDADLAAVLTYVRGQFGNAAAAVAAEEVAAARTARARS